MTVDLLITGANGQLGFELARLCELRGLQYAAFARDELDISNPSSVDEAVRRLKPKVVINAAAYTAVDRAESEAELADAVNYKGPGYLAAAADAFGAALIHISTDYVFDGSKSSPYTENDPVAPLGAYGGSKELGEQAVRAGTDRHVILRTAWVYGTHGANFVKTMLRLGAEQSNLSVVDDQKGCPTYAADLAQVLLKLSESLLDDRFPETGYGTFHCAGSGETTWCGFARKIFELAPERCKPDLVVTAIGTADYPTPAKRPANSVLNCDRLAAVHGVRLRPWTEALSEMLSELD